MPRRPESPGQFDLFDDSAGKPLPPEETPPEPPSQSAVDVPTEQDERDATALLYGEGATLVTPKDRAADRRERHRIIEETLRKIGRPTNAPILDAVERRRRQQGNRGRKAG